MAFMQKQVARMSCWQIETTCGTESVPVDVVGWAIDEPAPMKALEIYLEGKPLDEPELVTGYFCRLSAPGYMDCTEWSGPYDTAKEANEALSEMYGDDEGEC